MNDRVEKSCKALDQIFEIFENLPNATTLQSDSQGWTFPAVSASHVAWLAKGLAESMRRSGWGDLSEDNTSVLFDVESTLDQIVKNVLPNASANPAAAVQTTALSLTFVSAELSPLLGWDSSDKTRLPSPLIRRISQLQREVDGLIPDKERLSSQIQLISEATEAAEALPTTLQELKLTQAEVRQASNTSSEMIGKIQQLHIEAQKYRDEAAKLAAEGGNLIAKASEAYRVTTTIGLAAAFDERAVKLNISIRWWVAGLATSLIMLLVIGYIRLEDMREAFSSTTFEGTKVWTQVALSVLSVGAPIWFAWLSTKQIGQRFRLAEDYAFKASVSKAYEGYRREARDLSPEFAQSLFGSALKRLDEAPLRLLELPTHGSPLHEALQSGLVANLLDRRKEKALKEVGGASKQADPA